MSPRPRPGCPHCGAEIVDADRFCGQCGGRLPGGWPPCVHPHPSERPYCGVCGDALGPAGDAVVPSSGATPAKRGHARSRSAARRAPPPVDAPTPAATKGRHRRSALDWERKRVTLMLVSISGLPGTSEGEDPEEVRAIVGRALRAITGTVHLHGGGITQELGNGVLALFGAPVALEDHPHRALSAALAIQDGLTTFKREIRDRSGLRLRVRMGIHTGLVFFSQDGRDLRAEELAVGDTTRLTARLLAAAGPGEMLVSADTHRLAEARFEFVDRGDCPVPGKAEPVRVYQLASERRGRGRLEMPPGRRLTPFMGRTRELERLATAYRWATEGEGGVVVVTGQPGMGKSRLLHEFLSRLETGEVRELGAACVAHGRAVPYHPIVELVRRDLALDGIAAGEARARIAERLGALGIEGEEPVMLLAHLLGTPIPDGFLARLPEAQLRERTLDVLSRLWTHASRARPVVMVVEDLQWIDASSEALLDHLTRRLAGHRLLLLLSTRPDDVPEWLAPPRAETLAVEGLDARGVRGIALAGLRSEAVGETLVELLLERGEGNPLYVEQAVRWLRDTGGIQVEHGEARLAAREAQLPATPRELIALRIDRLPDDVAHTLGVAAVVGQQFARPLLSRVMTASGESPGRLVEHLARLAREEIVFPLAGDLGPACAFTHALARDAAYATLPAEQLRAWHAAVGSGLEALLDGRIDQIVPLLAHHYGQSAEDDLAVDYALRAAEQAQRRWASTEALRHLEAALARLSTMPDSVPHQRRRIDAELQRAEVTVALGRQSESLEALEALHDLVERTADPRRRALWHYWTGFLRSLTGGRPERAIGHAREASRTAEAAGLAEIEASAQSCLAHVLVLAGDLRGAVVAGERALAISERLGHLHGTCRALEALAPAAAATGEWERSLECGRRLLQHGEALGDRRLRIVAWWRIGATHVFRGDFPEGLRCFREALALEPRAFDVAFIKALQGYGLVRSGEVDAGTGQLEEAVAWFEDSNLRYTHAVFALRLGEGHLRQGRRPAARQLVAEALATCRELGYRHVEGVATRLLGEILAPDEPQAAAEHLEAAGRILEEVGARNDVAKTLVAQAELRRASGDAEGARARYQRALTVFASLGTLDEPPRVRAALVALEAIEAGAGVVVVSRREPELYQHLLRELPAGGPVRVVVDRRNGDRRQRESRVRFRTALGAAAERRRAQRRQLERRARHVDTAIRSVGYAFLPPDYTV